MRTGLLYMIVMTISLGVISCYSQEEKELQFHLLGQDDDMSVLNREEHTSIYERLKWIDLGHQNSLSFGGDYRFQTESFSNAGFTDNGNQDKIWYLNRLLVHAHFKFAQRFELFMELNSSTVVDKDNPSPVDKDVMAVNQAFVKYHFNSNWSILLGRENLKFGTRRLVDIREGPNVRRSFDLVQLDYINNIIKITAFTSVPVKNKPKAFDNKYLDFDETFSGIYATKIISTSFGLDVYGFYQKDNDVTYNIGTSNERRYSTGARVFGTVNNFTFNNEAVYQFGNFGNLNIQAYTVSLQGEFVFNFIADKTTVGLKTELISGNKNNDDNKMNTFDALYPRGAYFGRVAQFGPSNLMDIHPYLNVKKGNYYAELDYEAFWRYSNSDGVYGAALLLDFPSTNDKKFIGQQIGTLVGCDVNNHFNIEFETNIISPGSFLKESSLSETLFHAVVTAEFKF